MDDGSWDDVPTCRICHCTESPSSCMVKLISPCQCSGSLKYVHHSCLRQWLDATNNQRCELCKHPFSMSVKYKPIHKWGSLNASPSERRRLICNSVFNLVSMVCIFWSIYVLIERASLDAKIGQIDWSFYVKISVVTIGLIIGVIFLFVQLKLYFSIFMKWRQSNRIVVIRNANLSTHVPSTTISVTATSLNSPSVAIATINPNSSAIANEIMVSCANTQDDTQTSNETNYTAIDLTSSSLKINVEPDKHTSGKFDDNSIEIGSDDVTTEGSKPHPTSARIDLTID